MKSYWLDDKMTGFCDWVFEMKFGLKKIVLFPFAILVSFIDFMMFGWIAFKGTSGPN